MTEETAELALRAYVYFDHVGASDFGGRLVLLGDLFAAGGGRAKRNLMVPTGMNVDPLRVQVAPGRYICEISLPSGGVATAEAEATEGEVALLEVNIDRSPHESHSWQYLIGSVEPFEQFRKHHQGLDTPQPEVLWGTDVDDRLAWSGDIENLSPFVRGGGAAHGWSPVQPHFANEGTFIYRFTSAGPQGRRSLATTGRRRWCAVRTSIGEFLVTVPAPWTDPDTLKELPVEMLIQTDPPKGRSPISVTVRDPRLGGGLGYFATGSLDLAGKMFASSEDMLFEKMENPLAAAAAAYVLLGTDGGRDEPAWRQWVYNLRTFQGWLPDSQILAATQQLRQAAMADELRAAHDALVDAYRAGVPVYSIGLRWLVEGLSLVTRDDEIQAMLTTIRQLSYRVDMTQPFVILRLSD